MSDPAYHCGVCGGEEHEYSYIAFPMTWRSVCKTCGLVTRCDLQIGPPKPKPKPSPPPSPPALYDPDFPYGF